MSSTGHVASFCLSSHWTERHSPFPNVWVVQMFLFIKLWYSPQILMFFPNISSPWMEIQFLLHQKLGSREAGMQQGSKMRGSLAEGMHLQSKFVEHPLSNFEIKRKIQLKEMPMGIWPVYPFCGSHGSFNCALAVLQPRLHIACVWSGMWRMPPLWWPLIFNFLFCCHKSSLSPRQEGWRVPLTPPLQFTHSMLFPAQEG